MFELVPSEYMRTILEEEGIVFTDFQKAALIWNAPGRSWEEKLEALWELMGHTEDAALRGQIEERLRYEEEAFRRFADNAKGRYVYVVAAHGEIIIEGIGYFAEYEMAREYVLGRIRENDESPAGDYSIEKQVIVRDRSDLTVKIRNSRSSLYREEEEEEYAGWRTSVVQFDREGRIRSFDTGEMSREEMAAVDAFRPGRFETLFIKLPFDAQMGASVRNLKDPEGDYTDYGILMCDTKRWEDELHGVEKRQPNVYFSDIQVEVCFLTCWGVWASESINPLYLEIGERLMYGEDEKERAYARALEAFGEYWHYRSRGTRTEEALAALKKTVMQTAEAYQDACLEHDAQERKSEVGKEAMWFYLERDWKKGSRRK